MLAARSVMRDVDVIVWGSSDARTVTVDAVQIGREFIGVDKLSLEEMVLAREALADAWERACWAPCGAELRAA